MRRAHAHGYIPAGAESREPLTSSSPFRAAWEKPSFSLRLFPLSAKGRANSLSCRTTRAPLRTHGLPSSYLTQRERGRQELLGQAAGWPVLALSSVSLTPAAQLEAQLHSLNGPLPGQAVTRTPGGKRQALPLLSLSRQVTPGHPQPRYLLSPVRRWGPDLESTGSSPRAAQKGQSRARSRTRGSPTRAYEPEPEVLFFFFL